MKIAFLNRYQVDVERGAEIFIDELVKRLSKNHSVDVFFGEKADSIKEVIEGRYDVVVPVNGRLQSLKVSLGKIFGGYKVLITGHSGKGWDDIWNITVARPNVFVALTQSMAAWAKQWAWGIKVVKIPNGVDLNKFNPNGGKISLGLPRPIILSVGSLIWYKHLERVIEAVSKLRIGSVLIAGNGPLKDELKKKGEKLGRRFMLVNFPYQDMPKVYRSVDLFTLPSWDREAFGIVYLEAMASGLGIVAPDDQSRREIIGNAGIFTDVSNIEKYASSLKQALDISWKEKAINQAGKFSWDKIVKEYEKVFEELMGEESSV